MARPYLYDGDQRCVRAIVTEWENLNIPDHTSSLGFTIKRNATSLAVRRQRLFWAIALTLAAASYGMHHQMRSHSPVDLSEVCSFEFPLDSALCCLVISDDWSHAAVRTHSHRNLTKSNQFRQITSVEQNFDLLERKRQSFAKLGEFRSMNWTAWALLKSNKFISMHNTVNSLLSFGP